MNTNIANVLSKIQGGEAGEKGGVAEQQNGRHEGNKRMEERKR